MNVYVSHISALLFWRAWSAVLRIPLRVFHDMRTVDPSLLPFRLYPTSEMLRDCALRGRDVEDLLERGERGARTGDPAAVALTEVTEMVEAGDLRWHVLVARDQGTRNSSRIVRPRTSAC